MRTVRVVGFGSGPDQLTAEAVAALRASAYVVAADKGGDKGGDAGGGDPLLAVRRAVCEAVGLPLVAVPDPARDRRPADTTAYGDAVAAWHEARVAAYEQVLRERPGDPAFLVWGDPSLYDSTLRVVDRLRDRLALAVEVVPGIAAPQLLAARHRIVLHEVGRPVLVTTGRRLAEAVAAGHDNVVVMLDGHLTCAGLGLEEWSLWWGANLGTPSEEIVAGRLGEVLDDVRTARRRAVEGAGWVMDTYLLRGPG
ncbi:precorrin-6A synthase (deacetylating) [Nocardioides sp. SYSU DS0663]|uniref:precorrin-6A synthase (deacetylating) n=1 Tax=Nocardioides sp. SYSU DS0663 TaxID=3416445 RepID=UPI003F4C7D10